MGRCALSRSLPIVTVTNRKSRNRMVRKDRGPAAPDESPQSDVRAPLDPSVLPPPRSTGTPTQGGPPAYCFFAETGTGGGLMAENPRWCQ
jgi:hypothetical protein